MKTWSGLAVILAMALWGMPPDVRGCGRGLDDATAARYAVSEYPGQASLGIAALRGRGSKGLEALFAAHAEAIGRFRKDPGAAEDLLWERIRAALDTVGQQKDCADSRLYWHTDMASAQEAARAAARPILSLRLLGKLTDEFC